MNLFVLIEKCKTSQKQELSAALHELMKAVKFIEENGKNKELTPIEQALTFFAQFLRNDVADDIQGDTISIFRRVPINLETRDELIKLANSGKHPLVIEALGYIDSSVWITEIEELLINALEHKGCVHHAMNGLYVNAKQLKHEATVTAITQIAQQAFQFESTPSNLALVADKSVMTLGLLTHTKLKKASITAINALIENVWKEKADKLLTLLKSSKAKGVNYDCF